MIEKVAVDFLDTFKLTLELSVLAENAVISKVISELENNMALQNWVQTGLSLHSEGGKCKFCKAPLTTSRLEELNQHFSDAFEEHKKALNALEKRLIAGQKDIRLPDKGDFYDTFLVRFKKHKKDFESAKKVYDAKIEALSEAVEDKRKNPFVKVEVSNVSAVQDTDLNSIVNEINEVIDQNNTTTERFEEEKSNAFETLKRHHTGNFLLAIKYADVLERLGKIHTEIDKKQKEIANTRNTIQGLEENISHSAKGAALINENLLSYFGKDDIQISVNENGRFQLTRNERVAKNLSEGEKTAIAFCHFMTKLEENNLSLEDEIIWVDDPISSLDANHLYNTFSFIKERLGKCGQLFVSTHNLEFFNLIKNWMKHRDGKLERCSIFMIERKKAPDAEDYSVISNLPKVLLRSNSKMSTYLRKCTNFMLVRLPIMTCSSSSLTLQGDFWKHSLDSNFHI